MLNIIKKHISHYFINNNLKSNQRALDSKFLRFSETQKVGILFSGSDKKNNLIVKETVNYFNNKKINCVALGFVKRKKMHEHNLTSLNMDFFNLKDCDFFGIPKSNNAISFMKEKFDILINISNENHFLYDYIVTKSKSKLKIGQDNSDYYDLIIKSDFGNVGDFVKEVIFYLELINSNNAK